MQNIKIKAPKSFIDILRNRQLSPLQLIPEVGYYYKHHFVLIDIDIDNNILSGCVGTANEEDNSKLIGACKLSIDGEYTISVIIE